jgi:hypothetical protein
VPPPHILLCGTDHPPVAARLSSKGIAIGIVATVIGLIVAYSYGFKIIHVASMKTTGLFIADVHPDFAAAVEQQQNHGKR